MLEVDLDRCHDRMRGLADRVEQERQERLYLDDWMNRLRFQRSDDHAEWAFQQLEHERKSQALRDEVAAVHSQHLAYQRHIERVERELKNLVDALGRGGCIRSRKKPHTDSTGGDVQHKT